MIKDGKTFHSRFFRNGIDLFLLFLILKILVISELITKKNRKKYNKEYHLLEEENDKKWSRV